MSPIKYGILGCGKHALQSHAIPGKEVKEFKLTTLCDISETNMDAFEEAYGESLLKFTDSGKFFHSDVEAVLIATPDEYHFSNLFSVVQMGKHCLVEKPLVTTIKDLKSLQTILDTADDHDIIITSCHPRRFDPPFVWLKENLDGLMRNLGNVVSFHFDFSYHKPSKDWKQERGLLLDHVNHEIDLLHYLFGHQEFQTSKLIDSFDRYHVTGVREDDIVFEFRGTRRLDLRKYPEWATIRFDSGEVSIDAHQGKARVYFHNLGRVKETDIPPTDYQQRNFGVMQNFADAIRGSCKSYLSADDLYVNSAMSVILTERRNFISGS